MQFLLPQYFNLRPVGLKNLICRHCFHQKNKDPGAQGTPEFDLVKFYTDMPCLSNTFMKNLVQLNQDLNYYLFTGFASGKFL